ncbi:very long-chain specific acyl-CoA dehydrogenase-like protein [Dinothrombium tinctorium]|uniref:Very long-chain specific acyl-CoA dehydrogenase, mitochondrial n=1 Tax=Dinothrombium tinctorium TaxID=1965070 RepID=A0A443R9Z6_9ACAR|nr:very long-chain specific acyl-CoA dehydrogenase-like protein [Dinothrombium tinctorium]
MRTQPNGFLATAQNPAVNKSNERKREMKAQETNSFVMNLFSGTLKTEQVFPYPNVLTEEQHETLAMVREPCDRLYREMNDPLRNDATETIDEELIKNLKDVGAFGIQVPVEYGGAGLNNTQYARLGEIMGTSDLGIGIMLGAHQSIGYKGILLYGTDEQKTKYLPDLATGKRIAAFCLTEPSSGSDAGSIQSKAELSSDGKYYILNGSKIWISNGGIADVFTVFAQMPTKKPNGEVVNKVSAFIVERQFGGVTSGPPEKKMGIKCSNTAEVYFDNVKVPVENILGEVGGGFKVAMNILNSGRFGMAAALSGCMKRCIAQAVDHANNRVQFGNKISTYGAIQEKIARMAMAQYTGESLAYMIAGNMDSGYKDFQLEAAIGKVFSSEAAWFVVDEAIQILGGLGYMRSAGIEKVMRDLRIFRIFEGTNDILRLFIALTGLQHAGGHLKELQKAMQNPAANLGMIFAEGTKRVFRAVGLGSGPSLQEFVNPQLKDSAALVSSSIQNFGATVEHLLMKYNKNIINEQFLLNRLANSAIDIYTMVTVLSRATRSFEKNYSSAEYEANLVKAICREGSIRCQANLASVRAQESLDLYKTMRAISETVCKSSGVAQVHPIDATSAGTRQSAEATAKTANEFIFSRDRSASKEERSKQEMRSDAKFSRADEDIHREETDLRKRRHVDKDLDKYHSVSSLDADVFEEDKHETSYEVERKKLREKKSQKVTKFDFGETLEKVDRKTAREEDICAKKAAETKMKEQTVYEPLIIKHPKEIRTIVADEDKLDRVEKYSICSKKFEQTMKSDICSFAGEKERSLSPQPLTKTIDSSAIKSFATRKPFGGEQPTSRLSSREQQQQQQQQVIGEKSDDFVCDKVKLIAEKSKRDEVEKRESDANEMTAQVSLKCTNIDALIKCNDDKPVEISVQIPYRNLISKVCLDFREINEK